MNKTAIKNFAVWARETLLQSVKQKAYELGVTQQGIGENCPQELAEQIGLKGYDQVMEEAAYTWFNRFIALRYMEVNGFLPSQVRVFTNEKGEFQPELLKEALTVDLEGLDCSRVMELLDSRNSEALYQYLLITQCNALNECLPLMFEKIANWTELLFPKNLLRPEGVLGQLVAQIPEEDWLDAVQIIGWLYQYYNSRLKDEAFALLKKNVKVSKERIPAATQLFTPDWIVCYLVENSLGKLYVQSELSRQNHRQEKQIAEEMGWKFYLPEAEICRQGEPLDLTELKIMDPCMGSGHILVYAFEVLMQIYRAYGWSDRDAAKSVLENNLYGLDIDDRAGQLAYFAVMMKARKYNRRIFKEQLRPNVFGIQDGTAFCGKQELKGALRDAKEYGSLLKVPELDLEASDDPLIRQARAMAQQYDVVITNPPYMGKKSLNDRLSAYLEQHYPLGKSELYAAFICRCKEMTKPGGFTAMVTIHSWMFISSFEKLRKELLQRSTVSSMVHTGAATFEELNAFNVLATAFVLRNTSCPGYRSTFLRLAHYYRTEEKISHFTDPDCRYSLRQEEFLQIPGAPFVYWVSRQAREQFIRFESLRSLAEPKQGLATGDNDRFVRYWQEVAADTIGFGLPSREAAWDSGKKWFPYNKGGDFRKWYGMNRYVVNWEQDGAAIRGFADEGGKLRSRPQNTQYYFQKGITWSLFGFENFGVRYKTEGFVFDVSGSSLFPEEDVVFYILAFLAGKVAFHYLSVLAPTVNFQVGNIGDLPLRIDAEQKARVTQISRETVNLSRADWDAFETSWDFKRHPLI